MSMAYETPAQVAKLGEIDPEFKEFVENNAFPPRDFSDLKKLQADRVEQEKLTIQALGPPPSSITETPETITLRDGFKAEHMVWRPKQTPESGSPLLVLCHGGGFCVGSPSQYTALGRALSSLYSAVVVSLKYRLAPDHTFPTAPEDAWEGLVWAANNAQALGANLKKGFVLGGVSAGGNLTAVLAQKSLSRGGLPSPLTGLWLSVPVVLDEKHFEKGLVDKKYKDVFFSYEQNKKAPILDQVAIDAFMGAYKPDPSNELYSPFVVEKPHVGLPKSYVQVCGMDPLRDDGLIYERVLREHGVETRLDVFPGLPHASWAFLPQLESSKKIANLTTKGFGWLLGTEEKEVPREVKKGGESLGAGGA